MPQQQKQDPVDSFLALPKDQQKNMYEGLSPEGRNKLFKAIQGRQKPPQQQKLGFGVERYKYNLQQAFSPEHMEEAYQNVVKPITDVSAPKMVLDVYNKLTGKPSEIKQLPGKMVTSFALLGGPEMEGVGLSPKPEEAPKADPQAMNQRISKYVSQTDKVREGIKSAGKMREEEPLETEMRTGTKPKGQTAQVLKDQINSLKMHLERNPGDYNTVSKLRTLEENFHAVMREELLGRLSKIAQDIQAAEKASPGSAGEDLTAKLKESVEAVKAQRPNSNTPEGAARHAQAIKAASAKLGPKATVRELLQEADRIERGMN